jgi:hypothetical protein
MSDAAHATQADNRSGFFINAGTHSGWFTTAQVDVYDICKLEPREVTDPHSGEVSIIGEVSRRRAIAISQPRTPSCNQSSRRAAHVPLNCSPPKPRIFRSTSRYVIALEKAIRTSTRSGTHAADTPSWRATSKASAACALSAMYWNGIPPKLSKRNAPTGQPLRPNRQRLNRMPPLRESVQTPAQEKRAHQKHRLRPTNVLRELEKRPKK